MKKLFAAIALSASLAACATTSLQSAVSYSCVGMAGAIRGLTVARAEGKLSVGTVNKVSSAINIVDPYCGSDTPPTMDSVTLTAFNQARELLLSELDKVK